ncbi:hypothetical protein BC826DRAFT_1060003 [Russula brevipes]|nr:hypothetical protein BC826DRAFT_1060003 [Russula brevipes]
MNMIIICSRAACLTSAPPSIAPVIHARYRDDAHNAHSVYGRRQGKTQCFNRKRTTGLETRSTKHEQRLCLVVIFAAEIPYDRLHSAVGVLD